jgi:hypothetical protein
MDVTMNLRNTEPVGDDFKMTLLGAASGNDSFENASGNWARLESLLPTTIGSLLTDKMRGRSTEVVVRAVDASNDDSDKRAFVE